MHWSQFHLHKYRLPDQRWGSHGNDPYGRYYVHVHTCDSYPDFQLHTPFVATRRKYACPNDQNDSVSRRLGLLNRRGIREDGGSIVSFVACAVVFGMLFGVIYFSMALYLSLTSPRPPGKAAGMPWCEWNPALTLRTLQTAMLRTRRFKPMCRILDIRPSTQQVI